MFIATEDTPNPATLKFLPGSNVLPEGARPADFTTAAAAALASPLAASLFRIEGVRGVFLGSDFISVTKTDARSWATLKPFLLGVIMDHFSSGLPVLTETAVASPASAGGSETEIERQIRDLIDSRIRPAVAADGGDIVFDRFENGVVWLQMRGACSGCPSSTATLKSGIERMLKHYIPEVTDVRAVAA